MMFWIIAAAVVVVLVAIAWVTSGRAKPGSSLSRTSRADSDVEGYAKMHQASHPHNGFGSTF